MSSSVIARFSLGNPQCHGITLSRCTNLKLLDPKWAQRVTCLTCLQKKVSQRWSVFFHRHKNDPQFLVLEATNRYLHFFINQDTLCSGFFSWRQHRNGSISLTRNGFEVASWELVFFLYTPKGLERNGRGVPTWYRGSRKRHAVWGATGGRSENVVFYPGVWGKWLESEPDDSKLPPSSFGGFSS